MAKKSLITLANICLLIAIIVINHFAWIGIDFKYYFPTLFGFIAILYNTPKPSSTHVRNIFNGYLIGFAIDTFLRRLFGYNETHTGEVLAVAFPLIGYFWRNYRSQTELAMKVTGVSALIKGFITLLDKLFL